MGVGVDDLLEDALDARLVFVTLGDKFISRVIIGDWILKTPMK